MVVEQGQKVEEAAGPGDNVERPLEAADVRDVFGKILKFIRDFPWMGLGVISTCFGGMLLYAYFRHIEYTPSDITAVLGVGAAIAAVAVAYLGLATFSLAAPHWVYALSDSCRDVDWRRFTGRWSAANPFLIGSQLLGVGLMFAWVGWDIWNRCLGGVTYLFYPVTVLAMGGVALVGWASWRRAGLSVERVWAFVSLLAVSVLPLLFLYDWLIPSRGVTEWHALLGLMVWVVLVLLLGIVPEKTPVWALLLIAPFFLPFFLWSMALLFKGDGYALPKYVMEPAGIRGSQPVELRVPSSTCELVAAAVAEGNEQVARVCAAGGGWGVVHAQVLSNLGSRWWIEVKQLGPLPLDSGKALRMTIPAESVQIVRRTPTNTKPASACKA